METNNLINRIYYYYKDLARVIYAFYDNKHYVPEDLDVDKFTELCKRNLIDAHHSVLFDFLEKNDVKLAIMSKFATNRFEYNVVYMCDFIYGCDCESRKEAEYRAVMAAIDLLNKAMKDGKTIKYVK